MCLEKQETSNGDLQTHTDGRKQPIIFIKKAQALTSPGTIFKLVSISNELYKFECQGDNLNSYMNGKNIGFSAPKTRLGMTYYSGNVYTNSTFDVTAKNAENSKSMYIRTEAGNWLYQTNGYLQDEPKRANLASYISIGGSKQSTCEFYFEEVTGEGDAYLGLPLNDPDKKKSYEITCTYYIVYNSSDHSQDQKGSVSGSGTYGISDTQYNSVDNSYYTSVCFSVPVVVPSNVNCFFINSSNEAVPVQFAEQRYSRFGPNIDVMPAGIPFIVQTATNDPTLYRFHPLVPDDFITSKNPTNYSVNKLTKANSYFVAAASTNRVNGKRLLGVDASGAVRYPQTPTIGTSELTDGNRAYYGQQSEIIENLPVPAQLVELIYQKKNNGADMYTEQDFVSISDELVVGYVNQAAGIVFAHDLENNKEGDTSGDYASIQPVVNTPTNYFNFKPDGNNVIYPGDYNQSNWVAISAPNECSKFTVGNIIPANSVTGYIGHDKKNPSFRLFSAPDNTPNYAGQHHKINSYCVAHLATDANHELEAHSTNHNGEKFWFMPPRAMEVANMVWVVLKYDEANDVIYAYLPVQDGNQNGHAFKGKVGISPLYFDGAVPSADQLRAWDGQAFQFKAVIAKETGTTIGSMLREYEVDTDTPLSRNYVICPLSIDDSNLITTSINEVMIDSLINKIAKSVRYYNLQGIESDKPFSGVNIVVVTYNDGTRTTMKLIK